jgi:hypothetical protein
MADESIGDAMLGETASDRRREQIMGLFAYALETSSVRAEGMSRILERIGVLEADVMSAFGDVESLIVAIARREAWLISEPLVTWRGGTVDGFARALMRFGCIAAGEYNVRLAGFVRMMTIERARDPWLGRRIYDVGPACVALNLRQFLSRGNQCGVVSIADPQLAAEQLMALARAPLIGALILTPSQAARARELRVVEEITRVVSCSSLDCKPGDKRDARAR